MIKIVNPYLVLLLAVATLVGCGSGGEAPQKMNVLFIAVDDLRPELGAYGHEYMHTPNIDRLASKSRVFKNHFVYVAACGPSRSSLLSGKRSLSWDVFSAIRQSGEKPDSIFSLPQLFKENGYRTVSIGKISHQPGGVMDSAQTIEEVPYSWDKTYAPAGIWGDPWKAFFSYAGGKFRSYGYGREEGDDRQPPIERADVDDEGYADGWNASEAVKQLQLLKDENFFLAVGFYKPHMPFNAPKKYWDLYDPDKIPKATFRALPDHAETDISLHANHNSYEPRTHYQWEGDTIGYAITPERGQMLKHGYCAAVSYVDAQIGKVMDKLESLDLLKNTIVVLWGDHGWHLGEYGIWGKHTNHDVALRSPLIIHVPGNPQPGKSTHSLAETIDIFPTLADICGLSLPEYLEGTSLASIIENPESKARNFALSARNAYGAKGYSIRDEKFRLMVWDRVDKPSEVELFDYSETSLPTENVVRNHPDKVNELMAIMRNTGFYPVKN